MGSGPPRARWAHDSAHPYVFAVRARREIDGHSATEVCRFGVTCSEYIRRHHSSLHRFLGRVQVVVLLVLVLPSIVVLARHAFGGWPAGLSFLLLSAATASCAIIG